MKASVFLSKTMEGNAFFSLPLSPLDIFSEFSRLLNQGGQKMQVLETCFGKIYLKFYFN